MAPPLFKKINRFLSSPIFIISGFSVLTLLLISFLNRHYTEFDWNLPLHHLPLIFMSLCLSLLFLCVSSWQWKIAARSFKIYLPISTAFSTTLTCSLIDLLVFPSKVSSDVFRSKSLGGVEFKESLKVVLFYRAAKAGPFLILTPLALLLVGVSPLWVGLGMMALIAAGLRFSGRIKSLAPSWKNLGVASLLTGLLIFTESVRSWLLIRLFHDVAMGSVMASHLISVGAGNLSGIPLGLGTKDLSWGLMLKNYLSGPQIILFLLLLRLTGEIFGAVLGWIVSGKKIWSIIKNTRK